MLEATVIQVDGYAFVGKSASNHWVPMDGSTKLGAADAASRPKELVLLALGGCTAFDVEMILRKRRVKLRDFRVEIEADEAPDPPMVFTAIRLTYHLEAEGATAKEVERAVRLSEEKYCSVSAMLRASVPMSWRVFLNGEEIATAGPSGPGE